MFEPWILANLLAAQRRGSLETVESLFYFEFSVLASHDCFTEENKAVCIKHVSVNFNYPALFQHR